MNKTIALAGLCLAAISPAASPAFAQTGEPAKELVQFCKMVAEQVPEFSVGQCLSLEKENATNEYAASCRYVRDQGLFPIDPDEDGPAPAITNVGECVAYIRALEAPPEA